MISRRRAILFRRLVISLVLGVLFTVASAWSIALAVESDGGAESRPSGIGEGWSYWSDRQFGTIIIKRVRAYFEMAEPLKQDYLAVRNRTLPHWSAVYQPPAPFGDDDDNDEVGEGTGRAVMYVEDARGWPLVCMCSERAIISNASGQRSVAVHGGIPLGSTDSQSSQRRAVVLPLRAIWKPFALNVVMLSMLAFALVFGPGMVRRAVRRRIGHCQRCGYNLRGVAKRTVCPECGTTAAEM